MKQFRQGDVLLIEVKKTDFKTKGYTKAMGKTLALGEATGHHHTFDGEVEVFVEDETKTLAVNNQGMLVDVKEDSVLTHQEHAPISVPKGTYRRVIQREYSPEAIRNVMD